MTGLLVDTLARSYKPATFQTTVRVFIAAHGDEFAQERALLTAALSPLRAWLASQVSFDHVVALF
jgi:hypothetical protein